MSESLRIEIPRQVREGASAYTARVAYCTMGAGRSLANLSVATTKSITVLKRWSVRYEWVGSARQYDDTLAGLAAQQAGSDYLAEIEAHRARYGKTGKALYGIAVRMLNELGKALPEMVFHPSSLNIICHALNVSCDLEAHSLRLQGLLDSFDKPDEQL